MAEAKGGDPYLERAVQETLSGGYVSREESLFGLLRIPGGVDQGKKDIVEAIEITRQGVFKHVPDNDKRRQMEEVALNAAKDFWVKKLEESGLPTNAATLGRERIAEISERLEELAKPPENPT